MIARVDKSFEIFETGKEHNYNPLKEIAKQFRLDCQPGVEKEKQG